VINLRGHKDVRIARRAQIVSRLAQTISERKVQKCELRDKNLPKRLRDFLMM